MEKFSPVMHLSQPLLSEVISKKVLPQGYGFKLNLWDLCQLCGLNLGRSVVQIFCSKFHVQLKLMFFYNVGSMETCPQVVFDLQSLYYTCTRIFCGSILSLVQFLFSIFLW